MDLGECPKIHDLALRADYEKAQQKKDYFYDVEVSSNPTLDDFNLNNFNNLQGYGTSSSLHR